MENNAFFGLKCELYLYNIWVEVFNMNKDEMISDNRVDVYKWIKIGQAAILIILGILFVVTALLNRDTQAEVGSMLSISLGVILCVYGLLNVLSGYLLYRNPYNQDCLIGAALVSLATVLFVKRDVINEILSYFVSIFIIVCALLLVLHGVDMIIGKGIRKSIAKGVISFVLAALLIGISIAYLIFYVREKATVEIYMLLVLGVVLVILGIASLSILVIKIRNTNKMLKEKKFQEEQETQHSINKQDHPTNTEVRIIDINELRKGNKPGKGSDEQEITVIEDDDDDQNSDSTKALPNGK